MTTISYFRLAEGAVEYAPGEVIFEQDDPADRMFMIVAGEVHIHKDGVLLATLQEGTILGEMGLIDSQPRSATAIAGENCRLLPIDESRFHFLVQQNPFFALDVMRILTERIRNMNALVS